MPETLPPLMPGDRIGPYEILSRLGRGGMATVYLAKAVERCPVPQGRPVAVKVLTAPDDEERKRFAREARYLSSLQHPGIVRVLDTGEDRQRAWFVMPLVQGKRLDELVEPGQPLLDETTIIDLGIQILEALHVAHLAGILHRDLKPGNLMREDGGRVRLLDFGLAAAPDRESRLTREGDVVGTPAYMAPEQASGRREDIDRRTDLYAVGACLYELVTGRQPYVGPNTMAVLRAVIDEPLEPPSVHRPRISRDLETVILVAMAKSPRDRYRSAEEMARDLRLIRHGRRIRTSRLSAGTLLWRGAWRHRRSIAIVGLALFIAFAMTALTIRELVRRRAQNAPATAEDRTWLVEQRLAATTGEPALKWTIQPGYGGAIRLATLHPVDGPVRLGVTCELRGKNGNGTILELLVRDRDVGAGYRLRLVAGVKEDRLEMLREDKIVASRGLGRLARPSELELTLEQDEGVLSGRLELVAGGVVTMRFTDLVPLSGGDTSGVFIARDPGRAQVRSLLLEHRRGHEYVTALAKADMLRQDRRWARALQLYENFLADHAESPLARNALLNSALCHEHLGNLGRALEIFEQLVRENRDQQDFLILGTFHAWTCQLRLGQYAEAEASFAAIRRDFDLPKLLEVVPEDTLRELRGEYLARAAAQAAANPEQAITLAFTAADLADFLNEDNIQADALLAAGNLLMAAGRLDAARETYRRMESGDGVDAPHRVQALLARAVCERLQNNLTAAIATCRAALALNSDTSRVRFWLGDVLDIAGDADGALQQWQQAGIKDPIGILCRRLFDNSGPLPEADPKLNVPEGPYINARLIERSGGRNPATWLTRAAAGTSWGAALARARLAEER